MGYDCTLHVVDEEAIRERLAARLLGRSEGRSPFDEREDAAALWGEVRSALTQGVNGDGDSIGPEEVAGLVTQLAVVHAAAEHPSHYERGFCLSLWDDQPDGLSARVPKKYLGDPETMFGELIEEYPALKGAFPKEVRSNWCTGFFVPAEKIPDLLTWVERRVKRYAKPDQRLFRGLILVLRYAAENGLAYWEGTDLPISAPIAVMPSMPSRSGAEEFTPPDKIYLSYIGGDGNTLLFAHGIGFPQDCRTVVMDFSTWPPTYATIHEYMLSARRSREGHWVTVSMTSDLPYVFHARVGPTLDERRLLLPKEEGERSVKRAGFMGERVMAVLRGKGLRTTDDDYKPPIPLIEENGELVPAQGLPAMPERPTAYGFGNTNDGTDLLFWNGDGYELRDDAFEVTFPIHADFSPEDAMVPVEADGFFYTSKRWLWSVFRGQQPVRHIRHVDNIMRGSPGPEGAILLNEGENKRGDLGKLYFPYESTYIRIVPELFEDEDPADVRSLHWMESCGRLVAATAKRLWAVPCETVLALPRHDARTGKELPKGVTPKKSRAAFAPQPSDERPDIRVTRVPHLDFPAFVSKQGATIHFGGPRNGKPYVVAVDVSDGELSCDALDVRITMAAQSRGGRWVVLTSDAENRDLRQVCVGQDLTGPWKVLPPTDVPDTATAGIGFLDESAVACVAPPSEDASERLWHLMLEDDGALAVAEGMDAQTENPVIGFGRLGDGSDILVWGDSAYELRDGRFEKTFVLERPAWPFNGTAPCGVDGFFYIGLEEKSPVLYRVRRGEKATRCAIKTNWLSSVSPGPDGAVLLQDAQPRPGQLAILYQPDDETYIRIPVELFEREIEGTALELFWDESTDRLVLLTSGDQVLSVSMKYVFALPLYNAKTNRRVKKK